MYNVQFITLPDIKKKVFITCEDRCSRPVGDSLFAGDMSNELKVLLDDPNCKFHSSKLC